MTEAEVLDRLRVVLPEYLTPAQQADLWAQIRDFPDVPFYIPPGSVEEDVLQGDGWTGLVAVDVVELQRKAVRGVIVSNSCDIDPTNNRAREPNVLFAPLVRLDGYRGLLEAAGWNAERIDGQFRSIRRQEITNVFYLPSEQFGPDESLILLDDLHRQPLSSFLDADRTSLFRLSQIGFYVFLIKLSIHFSRFNESVARFPMSA